MEQIKTLKDSLIYQMSLGSKELYHSNVWAWIIEQDPMAITAFGIEDSLAKRVKRVGREEGDRDISIYLDDDKAGPVIVIENKLKSIPNCEQLKKYQNALGDRFYGGVLTGVVTPTIVNKDGVVEIDGKKWKFIEYSRIAECLSALVRSTKNETLIRNGETIEEYCRNVMAMHEIVLEKAKKNVVPLWDWELDGLGLQDLINKVKASSFMRYFDEQMEAQGLHYGPEFEHGHGFHNKKNTVDFRFVSSGEERLRIGVQIEGTQFRRFVQLKDNPGTKTYDDKLFSLFKGSWFDSVFYGHRNDDTRRIIWPGMENTPLKTLLTHSYAEYRVKNDYCFVYQYATLEDADFEYERLLNLIVENLTLAERLFYEALSEKPWEK